MNCSYVVITSLIATIICMSIINGIFINSNSVYMTANDPNNPGKYGGLIITKDVKCLADSLVNSDDTPHEKTMAYINWTRENIELKPAPLRLSHPDVIIKSRVGLCGDYAIVVTSFLATQKIPSRIIGMFFENSSHVIIEVYYDNSWHMYDPIYGVWVNECGVLSFEELRCGGAWNATLIYDNPRVITGFVEPWRYEIANPCGLLGPENPLWWPLEIDGEYTVPDIGKHAAGYRHIGAQYTNNFQNWTIYNLIPGKEYSFVIYPKFMWGNDTFVLHVNETGDYIIENPNISVADVTVAEATMPPVYINFTAHNTIENLHIYHDYRGIPNNVVVTIKKYSVIDLGS